MSDAYNRINEESTAIFEQIEQGHATDRPAVHSQLQELFRKATQCLQDLTAEYQTLRQSLRPTEPIVHANRTPGIALLTGSLLLIGASLGLTLTRYKPLTPWLGGGGIASGAVGLGITIWPSKQVEPSEPTLKTEEYAISHAKCLEFETAIHNWSELIKKQRLALGEYKG